MWRLNFRLAIVIWLFWAGIANALTIVSWNLEWFPGRSPRSNQTAKEKHITEVQQVLKRLNPDIFLAEEVADWKSFERCVSVIPALHVHAVSAFRDSFGTTRQQVCIASSLPANSSWSECFKRGHADPPRGFAFSAITLPDGKLLLVYAVHLKSNMAKNESDYQEDISKREDASKQLIAHSEDMIKAYKGYNVKGIVIGGDFNTNLDDKQFISEGTIRWLEQNGFWNSWTGVTRKQRLSWSGSSRFPATTFDYLIFKGLGKPTATLYPSDNASDHQPVVVKLEIK